MKGGSATPIVEGLQPTKAACGGFLAAGAAKPPRWTPRRQGGAGRCRAHPPSQLAAEPPLVRCHEPRLSWRTAHPNLCTTPGTLQRNDGCIMFITALGLQQCRVQHPAQGQGPQRCRSCSEVHRNLFHPNPPNAPCAASMPPEPCCLGITVLHLQAPPSFVLPRRCRFLHRRPHRREAQKEAAMAAHWNGGGWAPQDQGWHALKTTKQVRDSAGIGHWRQVGGA